MKVEIPFTPERQRMTVAVQLRSMQGEKQSWVLVLSKGSLESIERCLAKVPRPHARDRARMARTHAHVDG